MFYRSLIAGALGALFAAGSPAISATYTSQASFLAANPGLTLTSFTGQTAYLGDYLANPTSLGAITFSGTDLRYVSTSFWGSQDSLLDDAFNGNINVSIAPSTALGFYFSTGYADGVTASFTAFNGATPVFTRTLTGGSVYTSFSYFGVDGIGPITSFTLDSAGTGGFSSLAEVSNGAATAAVPEPAVWGLLVTGFGLVGVAVRRRRVALAA